MRFQPLNNRVMVLPVDMDKSSGGVALLSGSTIADHGEGEVREVSEDLSALIKVGMRVGYFKKSGLKTEINGQKVVLLTRDELLGYYVPNG